jgi:hypothetical protein
MPKTSSVCKAGTLTFAFENAPANPAMASAGAATTASNPISGAANNAIKPKIGKASNNINSSIILHLLFFHH